MDEEARRVVVGALVRLATSPDYQDRADAGRALASFAEVPESSRPLQALVLDVADTFVTRVTAEALLRREDVSGLAAVASALAFADANHADWIATAVHDVFGVYAANRDAAARVCEAMTEASDPPVRQGAAILQDILTRMNPVLHPLDEARSDPA